MRSKQLDGQRLRVRGSNGPVTVTMSHSQSVTVLNVLFGTVTVWSLWCPLTEFSSTLQAAGIMSTTTAVRAKPQAGEMSRLPEYTIIKYSYGSVVRVEEKLRPFWCDCECCR